MFGSTEERACPYYDIFGGYCFGARWAEGRFPNRSALSVTMLLLNRPIDEHWRSIVDYSLVPTTEHLYVVGSFAWSVTVYSQQVRAIGLVDALAGLGGFRKSSQVAIIGGGIAGLTAATALWKIGLQPIFTLTYTTGR
jgi:hypothetical protein